MTVYIFGIACIDFNTNMFNDPIHVEDLGIPVRKSAINDRIHFVENHKEDRRNVFVHDKQCGWENFDLAVASFLHNYK